ncbi:MAG: resistance to Congo red protein [Thermodesulfobacteriota bacterium]
MSDRGPLDVVPLWLLFLVTIMFVLLTIEVGFRIGRRRARGTDPEKESPVGAMVGASLGLLAFLLAFTFGFAASRFEARRTVLIEEVNAIGTAYLRTSMIPEPARGDARRLFREYVDVRLHAPRSGQSDAAIRRSLEIQGELWRGAAALGEASPQSIVLGLYVQSLNEVIDLHTKRVTEALRVRVPAVIWLVLYSVTALAMAELGYQTGLSGRRRPLSIPALALAFAAVMLLIADLDRPQAGMVRVSQQAMSELRQSMAE